MVSYLQLLGRSVTEYVRGK